MFARGVAMIGGTMARARGRREGSHEPAFGSTPVIPVAKPQGSLMTLKMPAARGWAAGQTPIAAPGLQVNAFATNLEHPRWIEVLSNGDVLVAEARGANET
jgi:glucose/arabinose dehydrogenase